MDDFTDWLLDQTDRNDPVGDLARDARDDPKRPTGNADAWRSYLSGKPAAVREALEDTIEEYQF